MIHTKMAVGRKEIAKSKPNFEANFLLIPDKGK